MSFHDARSQQRDTLAASLLPAYVTGRGVAVERELKMKLKTTHHLLLAITFSLAPLSAAVPFTDGFETGALNPFWTIEPGPGFVSMTTQAAHSGAQSLKLEASTVYPWVAGVLHDYGSDVFGSISVWAQTGVCCASGTGVSINSSSRWIAVLGRTSDGQLLARYLPPDGSPEIDTPLGPAGSGWRQFRIDATATGVTMMLDGVVVYSNPTVVKFRLIAMESWGAPGGSEYYDDFSATVDQPSTTCDADLAAAQQTIQSLQGQVSSLTTQLSTVQAQLAVAISQNTTLQGQVSTLTAQNAGLRSDLSALAQLLAGLQSDFRTTFANPGFTIPGTTLVGEYTALITGIEQLNRGDKLGLYRNLGGK
jgi:hypothetical protein